jgi:hypothetical protein
VGAEDELKELQEHAEEARESGLIAVSMTMALLAVIIALLTMMAHRAHTEEVLLQAKASDQWAYYQAKGIKRHNLEIAVDSIELHKITGPKAEEKLAKYEKGIEKYAEQEKEIEKEARGLEAEVKLLGERATRFDYGESLLAIALVVTSITLMTRNRGFWFVGMLVAAVGSFVGASAFLLH